MRFRIFLLLAVWLTLSFSGAQAVESPEGLHSGDMARLREAYKGRPMVVHLWSLTCAPCLEEFPKWARRIKRHPEVAFVFINTDGIRHARALGIRMQAAGLRPTRSLVYADDFVERLQYEISPDWYGELPRNELVQPSGAGVAKLGVLSDAEFEKWVRQTKR
jgi:thiol-disulfide isomerase/thioredoxin